MKVVRSVDEINELISGLKSQGRTIGFVPTMGALHKGHFSLIERSKKMTDITVCSIFVNPTQFNQVSDLNNYPRDILLDCKSLEQIGCDIVFIPAIEEVYPDGMEAENNIDFHQLDKVMEGKHRPGHFKGVVQIVKRLLEIVACDRLFMGQKDYQQFTIVRYMIDHYRLPVELVVCPIVRESNGLAMSSRNKRLSSDTHGKAGIIFRVLNQAKKWMAHKSPDEISRLAMEYLNVKPFKPEYFMVVDGKTLKSVTSGANATEIVACTAVWADGVRLIDNMILRSQKNI